LTTEIRHNQIELAFSKASNLYSQNSSVQKEVVKYIISKFAKNSFSTILDLGSGDGEITKNLLQKEILKSNYQILAVDFSEKMLDFHFKNSRIQTLKANFDETQSFQKIEKYFNKSQIDLVVSASALQWSKNLTQALKNIQNLKSKKTVLSLFTSNTYSEIQNYFDISSPILSLESILESVNLTFKNPKIEILNYSREFESSLDILKSIKNSGVSASLNRVSVAKLRKFIQDKPFSKLSYQVVLIEI